MRDAIFLCLGLVGCSGSQVDGVPVAPSDDASVADVGASDAGVPDDDGNVRRPHEAGTVAIDSGGDGGAGACADRADAEACGACCATTNMVGHNVIDKALLTCACETAHCASACATSICAATPSPPDGGDPCFACIHASVSPDAGDAGCIGEVMAACTADTDCMAYQQCTAGCGGTR